MATSHRPLAAPPGWYLHPNGGVHYWTGTGWDFTVSPPDLPDASTRASDAAAVWAFKRFSLGVFLALLIAATVLVLALSGIKPV